MFSKELKDELKKWLMDIKDEFRKKPVHSTVKYSALPIIMAGLFTMSTAMVIYRVIERVPRKNYLQVLLNKT